MTRLQANRRILHILEILVEKNPSERFGQLLRNAGVVREYRDTIYGNPIYWLNGFNEESEEILERVSKEAMKAMNGLERARVCTKGKGGA